MHHWPSATPSRLHKENQPENEEAKANTAEQGKLLEKACHKRDTDEQKRCA